MLQIRTIKTIENTQELVFLYPETIIESAHGKSTIVASYREAQPDPIKKTFETGLFLDIVKQPGTYLIDYLFIGPDPIGKRDIRENKIETSNYESAKTIAVELLTTEKQKFYAQLYTAYHLHPNTLSEIKVIEDPQLLENIDQRRNNLFNLDSHRPIVCSYAYNDGITKLNTNIYRAGRHFIAECFAYYTDRTPLIIKVQGFTIEEIKMKCLYWIESKINNLSAVYEQTKKSWHKWNSQTPILKTAH